MNDISVVQQKGQPGVDRLRRRLEKYRNRHDEALPRFQETVNGHNEQHKQETLILRQKYLEANKSKKPPKKSEKNKLNPTTTTAGTTPGHEPHSGPSSVNSNSAGTGSNKMLKRPCDDGDMSSGSGNGNESFEPLAKVPFGGSNCAGKQSSILQNHHSLNSSRNSSLQNSSVKNLNCSSVKSGSCSSPGATISSKSPLNMPTSCSSSNSNSASYTSTNVVNIEMKQEPSAFADLDQCAAALEKDAANSNGSIISGLIGLDDGASDGLIPSDTLKDLISEISDLNPDFMGDFDFEEDRNDVIVGISRNNPNTMNSNSNHNHTNSINNDVIKSSYSNHNHGHATPVAPVTPTASANTSSPRLSHVKIEADSCNTGRPNSVDSTSGNGGLSHCAGPSPAAASTASPLASQLSAHHPSQTPPYCSGSAMFDGSPPTQQTHSTSGSSTPNYCPQTSTPTPTTGMGGKSSGTRIPYTSPSGIHDSPAAQTLKQMAEQHQHKSQLGIGSFKTPQGSNPSPARSPFSGDGYGQQYGSSSEFNMNNSSANGSNFPNTRTQVSTNTSDPLNGVTIKQEVLFNSVPTSVPNFPPMDPVTKRNHHQHQQQDHSVPQHKPQGGMLPGLLNPSNNNRIPHPNNNHGVHPHPQQPPSSSSKSFNHTGNPAGHSGHNSNMHSGSGQITNPHAQHYNMNRPPNPGMHPNNPNFSQSNHSGYNPVNHPNIKMSQSQPMSINHQSNSSVSLPTTGSQPQQMAMGSAEMKPNMMNMSQTSNMSYYQNAPHSQSMQQMSHTEPSVSYMNSSSCSGQPQTQHQALSNITNQGQTINFTQQHLRMATGVNNTGMSQANMGRMMGGPPGVQGSSPMNTGPMPNRMSVPPRMQTNPGMNEIPQQPSQLDMQHRMMINQQQIRGPGIAMQQSQQMGMMMRSNGPEFKGELPGAQQLMGQNSNPNALMNRFNIGASAPGRPSMMGGPKQMGHRMNQQQGSMYHQQIQQGMNPSGCNQQMNMAGGVGNVNMGARRVPFTPNSGSAPMMPFRSSLNSNMINNQQGPPGIGMMSNGPSQDWQIQDPGNMRNFGGMQQQLRSAQNPSGFHPGMSQQQGQHAMNQGGNLPQGGMRVQNQMGYNHQQQHMEVHGNSFQPHLKMSQNSCGGPNNFPMKNGVMCSNNSNGANQSHNSLDSAQINHSSQQQSMLSQQHMMKSEIQSDFNFDLLDNISSGDNSSFGNDGGDYMNSFDSSTNYQHILDTL